ncbi:hypothetical protein DSECCO2_613960 [anaerobic digester metagenome]
MGCNLLTIDADDVITPFNIHTCFGKWGATLRIPVLTRIDIIDAVASGIFICNKLCAKQTAVYTLHTFNIAPVHI